MSQHLISLSRQKPVQSADCRRVICGDRHDDAKEAVEDSLGAIIVDPVTLIGQLEREFLQREHQQSQWELCSLLRFEVTGL